jgi:hypothetical protein
MFEAGVLDSGVAVDRMVARARQLSQLHAALLADLVAVADITPNPEFAAFEISAALTWTRRAADVQLDLAFTIVRTLPAVHAAMAAGEVDLPKARVIVDGVAALELDLAHSIVAQILPLAPGLTTGELRTRLAKLVISADPAAAAKRHQARKKQRRVELQPAEDSCAALLGLHLPADDALAASNRLTAFARALKQAGDPRSIDQLRADTFLNLLLGNTCSHHHTPPSNHHSSTTNGSSTTGFGLAGGGSTSSSPTSSSSTGHTSTGIASTGIGATGSGPASSASTGSGPAGSGPTGSASTGSGAAATGSASTGSGPAGSASAGGGSTSNATTGGAAGGSCSCSCGGSSRYRGGVELTGDLETLASLAQRPGDLGGYGPVIAEIARQVAAQQHRSPWTFTIRDPATGQIVTGPVRRRPTAAMARQVRARDRTCRAPGCRRIGIYTDIDHTIAVEHGGRTVPGNLGLLCRYHHRAKHKGWWLLIQIRPGVFVWRSPLGRRYTVHPAAP